MTLAMTIAERLLAKIRMDGETGCWNWTAYKNKDGYGQFRLNGKIIGAHRASYEIHCGVVPEGIHVLHRCDNPPCVNPAHLFLGTQTDNMIDRASKGRHPRTRMCGVDNPAAKLAPADVLAIRNISNLSHYEIARQYGVSRSLIQLILTGKRWQHL